MNKTKAIGTRQESAICKYINAWAGRTVCERVVLHGNKDHGDLRIVLRDNVLTGESKHCKRYPGEKQIEDFKAQTVTENGHASQDGGVLFVNLPGCNIRRMECWMTTGTLLMICDASAAAPDDGVWVRLTLADFCRTCFGEPSEGGDRP